MKQLLVALAFLVPCFSVANHAQPTCQHQTIEPLAKAIAARYEGKTLASLDAGKPYVGAVRIVIEHSLADDDAKDRFVIKRFASFARFEAWLKSREVEDLPARESRPLERCAKGACTYNFDGGILHNHLYLKKIIYGFRGRCPYLKTIYLLDGD